MENRTVYGSYACDDTNDIWMQIKAVLAESSIENSEEHVTHESGIEAAHEVACFIAHSPRIGEFVAVKCQGIGQQRLLAE
jgi:hypothetical protein